MKRTSVMLPDELSDMVDRERRRRDVSAATVIREAVEAYFVEPFRSGIESIIGIVNSGGAGEYDAANLEEFLERHWANNIEESSGLRAPRERHRRLEGERTDRGESGAIEGANAGDS